MPGATPPVDAPTAQIVGTADQRRWLRAGRSLLRRLSLGSAETLCLIAIPVVVLVTYLPVVAVPFATADDYAQLAAGHGLLTNPAHGIVDLIWADYLRNGRPLGGVFAVPAFSLAPDVDALRFVRLVSVVGIAILALLLYRRLRRHEFGPLLAAAASISVVSLPSFQVYAAWTTSFVSSFAALMAAAASVVLVPVADPSPGRAWAPRVVLGSLLLLCALLTYQQMAMFFWVFAAIEILQPARRFARAIRVFAWHLVAFVPAAVGELIVFKVLTHYYPATNAARGSVVSNLGGKLHWFVSEPLVNALNLYGLLPTHTLAIAMAALIIGGILLLHVDEGWKAFGFVALAVLLVPLSYAANLTTAEDWASYRSLGALASLCGIGLWFALLGVQRAAGGSAATAGMRLRYAAPLGAGLVISMSIVGLALVVEPLRAFPIATRGVDWPSVKWLATLAVLLAASSTVLVWRLRGAAHSSAAQPRFAAPLGAVAVLVVVAAGVLLAMRNVTSLFVEPMNDELSILQSSLHSGAADRANRIAVVTPGGFEGAAPLVRYDEFGVPALSHYWGPEPAVLMLLPPQRRSSVIVDALPPGSAHPANAFVVDMTPLRTLRHGWTVWSLRAR